ncbi:MAG: xanthine dehydrogenase [Methylocystis sp.]|uniref:xanthine dehydrogenase n=1 Tax=Methylocystis sp. TaxID=1911079 RepID=UPI003DA5ADF3
MDGTRIGRRPAALILGLNEIASATAVALHRAGYACLMSHDPFPPVIRRGMAYHDALFGEEIVLDGLPGRRVETAAEIAGVLRERRAIGVTPLALTDIIPLRLPDLLIDARMQKYLATPDWRHIARLTVGLGPRFEVGANCDIAIETRPADVGRILRRGVTEAADHAARDLGGLGAERFVYAERDGLWHTAVEIGARVYRGVVIGRLDGAPVTAPHDGVLRGLLRDGGRAFAGAKLLEIDPRGRAARWTGVDERGARIARAVADAVRLKEAEQAARLVATPLSTD